MDTLDQDVLERKSNENSVLFNNQYLLTAGAWARFVGISQYIFSVIFLVLTGIMVNTLIQINEQMKLFRNYSSQIYATYFVLALFYLLLAVILALYGTASFRFGSNVKRGVYFSNMNAFSKSFQNLRRHFLYGFIMLTFGIMMTLIQYLRLL